MQNPQMNNDQIIDQLLQGFQLSDGEQLQKYFKNEENLSEIFNILQNTNLNQVLVKLNQQKEISQLVSNFISTIILINRFKILAKKNKNLKICYNQMILSSKDNFLFSLPQKRTRKKKDEITRDFRCLYPYCEKAYGTNNTLRQHMRNKHREFLYKLDYLKQKYGNQNKNVSKVQPDKNSSFIDDKSEDSIVIEEDNNSNETDQEFNLDEDFFAQLIILYQIKILQQNLCGFQNQQNHLLLLLKQIIKLSNFNSQIKIIKTKTMYTKTIILFTSLIMVSFQMRQFENQSINQGIENLDKSHQNLIETILNIYESTNEYDEQVIEDIAQSLIVIFKLKLSEIDQESLNEDKQQFFKNIYDVIQKYSQDQISKDQLVQNFQKVSEFNNVFSNLEQYKILADEINEIVNIDDIGVNEQKKLQQKLIDQQKNNQGYLEIFLYLISQSEIQYQSQNQKLNSGFLSEKLFKILNEILEQNDTIERSKLLNQYLNELNLYVDQKQQDHFELVFFLQEQFYEIMKKLNLNNKSYLGEIVQQILKKLYDNQEQQRVIEFIHLCFSILGKDRSYSDKYLEILKNEIQHNEFDFENDTNNISKFLIYDYFSFISYDQDNSINNEKLEKFLNHLVSFFNLPQENLTTNLPSILVGRTNLLTENNEILMHQILAFALQFRNISNTQSIEKFNQFIDQIPAENIKDIYVPVKLIIVSLLAGEDVNVTFIGDKMPQEDLYKEVLKNEQGIEQILLQLYSMKNTYILNEYDPVVYKQFLKDNTFNLSKLNLQKALISKPLLLFNDDQRGLFGEQTDLMQKTDNLVKVVAGKSQEILDQKILNEDEEKVIVQFIEENGIQEYSDEENEYENVYVIVRNAKSPCFKKN